ncbi:MAG: YceI family protein [Crocinitomicaceae bacterium]|nr:YceI family protein [Crocinitomicaceae bacterium]
MKLKEILIMATSAALITSCSNNPVSDIQNELEIEEVTYTLDTENSSLVWKGMMSPEYFHVGNITISDGTISMKNDVLSSGTFTVDMNSITATISDDFPEDKANYLAGHLMGTVTDEDHPANLFFNTPKFPNTTVTLGEYNNGKLDITLSIIGKELKQTIPATISSDDDEAAINGTFTLDLSSLEIPGLQADSETGEGISPSVEFKLDLQLNK